MKFATSTFAFLLVLLFAYLSGSFIAATFDITLWDSFGRFLVVCFGVVVGISAAIFAEEIL